MEPTCSRLVMQRDLQERKGWELPSWDGKIILITTEIEMILPINIGVCHSIRQGSVKEIGPVGDILRVVARN